MNATTDIPGPVSKTLSHIALQYRNTEDGPAAARLLEMLGCRKVQEIPLPNGTTFYQFAVDSNAPLMGDGILYLARASDQQLALIDAIRDALNVGKSTEHPAVQAMRDAQVADPEVGFHIGILMQSLEELEERVSKAREAATYDPGIKGRLTIVTNRAKRGDPMIDSRMDASPVFGGTPRQCYGRFGCQAFIETSLLSGGPLGENLVIELDYLFPGHPHHMFNMTEI
jgi:hypothetical protein